MKNINDYMIYSCNYSRVNSVEQMEYTAQFFEVISVYSGYMHFIIDGKGYVVQKGEVLLIRKGSVCIRCATAEKAYYFRICYRSDDPETNDLETALVKTSGNLQSVIKNIHRIFHNRNLKDYEKLCKITAGYLAFEIKGMIEASGGNHHVAKILEYISNHLTDDVSLESIANSVKLSVPYCCKLVKKELKITIQSLIENERVLLAKDYLLMNDVPIKHISELCGFNEYNAFYKCFKRHTGMGPADFRKEALLNNMTK